MSEENTTLEQEPEQIPAEAAPEQVSESAPEERPERKSGFEKRIDKLTAQYREEQRENERLRQQLESAKAAEPPSKAPTIDDFDSDAEYLEAVAEHKAREVLSKLEEKSQADKARAEQEAQESAAASSVHKMFARGTDSYEDFETLVTSPTLPLTNEMLAAIATTDNGHDVAYHLGKNPAEAAEISELSPVQQAIAIGRLGERLTTQTRAVSAAPEPVVPVDDTSAGISDPLSDSSDIKTWMAARNAAVRA